MVGARFGIGVDGDRTRPEFFSTHPCKVDGGFSVHARRGGHIPVQLIARYNPHALMFPFGNIVLGVMMVVIFMIMIVVMGVHLFDYLFFNKLLLNL